MAAWMVAVAAALVAAASWLVARRASRQVRDLTHMYWQLKFEHGELKARLERALPEADTAPRLPRGTQFVPLTNVKR